MTKWAESLHAQEAKEFLIGGTSTVDQVFLSHQSPHLPESNYNHNLDSCNNSLQKSPKSPKGHETKFDFDSDTKGPNCYQVTLSSLVIISVTCFLLVLCHEYIKDLLIWMENIDIGASFVIFTILYIVVSYPMAWGVILLMFACGYLYGFIYGAIVTEVCSAIGVGVAHVTMKNFCRNFIIKKFYNDKMTAVINVVGGKHGFKVVALTRLTPFPFGLQNSLFSLTDIPLHRYVAASSLGMLPTAVLNSYMGTTLRSMSDILTDETNQTTGYVVFVVQILFTIALMYFVVRKARIELKKTVEDDKVEEELANGGMPQIVVQATHPQFKDTVRTNGYIERTRHKSGD